MEKLRGHPHLKVGRSSEGHSKVIKRFYEELANTIFEEEFYVDRPRIYSAISGLPRTSVVFKLEIVMR